MDMGDSIGDEINHEVQHENDVQQSLGAGASDETRMKVEQNIVYDENKETESIRCIDSEVSGIATDGSADVSADSDIDDGVEVQDLDSSCREKGAQNINEGDTVIVNKHNSISVNGGCDAVVQDESVDEVCNGGGNCATIGETKPEAGGVRDVCISEIDNGHRTCQDSGEIQDLDDAGMIESNGASSNLNEISARLSVNDRDETLDYDEEMSRDGDSRTTTPVVKEEAATVGSSDEEGQLSEDEEEEVKTVPVKVEKKKKEPSSDVEEGELTSDEDEDDVAEPPKPAVAVLPPVKQEDVCEITAEDGEVCKFFARGKCTWGDTCKYRHTVPPPRPFEEPPIQQAFPPAERSYSPIPPVRGPPIPLLDIMTTAPAMPLTPLQSAVMGMENNFSQGPRARMDEPSRSPTPVGGRPAQKTESESAWDRGLRQAKEMIKKSAQRQETDTDFEQKRLHQPPAPAPRNRSRSGSGGSDKSEHADGPSRRHHHFDGFSQLPPHPLPPPGNGFGGDYNYEHLDPLAVIHPPNYGNGRRGGYCEAPYSLSQYGTTYAQHHSAGDYLPPPRRALLDPAYMDIEPPPVISPPYDNRRRQQPPPQQRSADTRRPDNRRPIPPPPPKRDRDHRSRRRPRTPTSPDRPLPYDPPSRAQQGNSAWRDPWRRSPDQSTSKRRRSRGRSSSCSSGSSSCSSSSSSSCSEDSRGRRRKGSARFSSSCSSSSCDSRSPTPKPKSKSSRAKAHPSGSKKSSAPNNVNPRPPPNSEVRQPVRLSASAASPAKPVAPKFEPPKPNGPLPKCLDTTPGPPPKRLKPSPAAPAAPAPVASNASDRVSASRREELLNQLKAVESAIAKKRTKTVPA